MSAETFIYHIIPASAWTSARQMGQLRENSLDTEGFIHCSTASQVLETANRYYLGQSTLILLRIRCGSVKAEIRYEISTGGESFPHIYGPVEIASIEGDQPLEPDMDGIFRLFPYPAAITKPGRTGRGVR